MKFPDGWKELDIYPDELFIRQLKLYKSENDSDGSEHYRLIRINLKNLHSNIRMEYY